MRGIFFVLFCSGLFTFGVAAASNESASTCSPVDLRDRLGPIRDQDGLSWCYGYTAADLLSFKLKKNISAMALTTNHIERHGSFQQWSQFLSSRRYRGYIFDQERGLDTEVLNEIKAGEKLCLESEVRSNSRYDGELATVLAKVEDLKAKSLIGKSSIEALCAPQLKKISKLYTAADLSSIRDAIVQSEQKNLFHKMNDLHCTGVKAPEIKVKNLKWKRLSLKPTEDDLVNEIDGQLSKGNIISAGFNNRVLIENGPLKRDNSHAAVVVGRQWNQATLSCDYVIRDSYGKDCTKYGERSMFCKGGYLTVSKDKFKSVLSSVTYLE